MNERCPLSTESPPDPNIEVPDTCRLQCEERFTQNRGEIEIYDSTDDEIRSKECGDRHGLDMEHSHDGLQAREGAKRAYSVVDSCVECDGEYMETVFTFNCPHHES